MKVSCAVLVFYCGFLSRVKPQKPSPCTDVLKYEDRNATSGSWFAILSLGTSEDLNGVWVLIGLDRDVEELTSESGETTEITSREYLIAYEDFQLKRRNTFLIKFSAKYNASKVTPSVVGIKVNGRLVCENPPTTTPANTAITLQRNSCGTISNNKDCVYPTKPRNQAAYYWRDYVGIVPIDAVPGGYKSDGNVTYIGQMSHPTSPGIYPGTIYAGQKEGVICELKRYADASYVKVLCSNPWNKFEWIKTTADETSLLTDYHLVVGGNQPGAVFNIGRVNFEGEVQVGRVYNSKSVNKGLWICGKAGSQTNFQIFELLVLAR